MATLQELSSADFKSFTNDSIVTKTYRTLSITEQKLYEISYKQNFSDEFRKQQNLLVEEQKIDKKTAGQIMVKVIKREHSNGNFFMDASGNVDTNKFKQIKEQIKEDLENGIYNDLIQKNTLRIENQNNQDYNKNIVDFNNPEAKKEFLENLFAEYSNLKTDEEKEKWKESHLYDYYDNKYIYNRGLERKENRRKIQTENPNLSDEQVNHLLNENKNDLQIQLDTTSEELSDLGALLEDLRQKLQNDPENQLLKSQFEDIKLNFDNQKTIIENLKVEIEKEEFSNQVKENNEQEVQQNNNTNSLKEDDDVEQNQEFQLETDSFDLEDLFNGMNLEEENEVSDSFADNITSNVKPKDSVISLETPTDKIREAIQEEMQKAAQLSETSIEVPESNMLKFFKKITDNLKKFPFIKNFFNNQHLQLNPGQDEKITNTNATINSDYKQLSESSNLKYLGDEFRDKTDINKNPDLLKAKKANSSIRIDKTQSIGN